MIVYTYSPQRKRKSTSSSITLSNNARSSPIEFRGSFINSKSMKPKKRRRKVCLCVLHARHRTPSNVLALVTDSDANSIITIQLNWLHLCDTFLSRLVCFFKSWRIKVNSTKKGHFHTSDISFDTWIVSTCIKIFRFWGLFAMLNNKKLGTRMSCILNGSCFYISFMLNF